MAENEGLTEREVMEEFNAAIADTEREIADYANSDEPLDLDGDRELEEMGEGLEGEHTLDADDIETRADTEVDPNEQLDASGKTEDEEGEPDEPDAGEGDEPQEGDEPDDGEGDEPAEGEEVDAAPPPRDQRGALRESRMRERAYRDEASQLRERLAQMEGRLEELSRRPAAPPQPPAPPPAPAPRPDMFAEPERYEQWMMEQADKRAEERMNARMQEFEQRQQQRSLERSNRSLAAAATGPRGFEFHAAYGRLTSDPNSAANREAASRILDAPDPAQAFWEWWEENGGPEYREEVAAQLTGDRPAPARRAGQPSRQQQSQPRHVVRVPPSLNSARGSGLREQNVDRNAYDDSDRSVFDFASSRG